MDHPAPAPLLHPRHDRPGQGHHAVEVQLDAVVPVLVPDLVDRLGDVPAGVVDQDVDLAEPLQGRPGHPVDVVALGHVGRDALDADARLAANLLAPRPVSGSSLRLQRNRSAPARANPAAIARPMPLLPPVTRATRPERSKMVFFMELLLLAEPGLKGAFELAETPSLDSVATPTRSAKGAKVTR